MSGRQHPDPENSGAAPPAGGRSWLRDSLLLALLVAAVGVVHGVDRGRNTAPGPVAGGPVSGPETPVATDDADAGREEDASAAIEPQAVAQDRQEPAEGEAENERPPPPRTSTIIADFVPFTTEHVVAREPPRRDLLELPDPPPVEQVVERPQPPVPEQPQQPQEPPARKVEFFETETRANAVGFVVDCSSSMDGAKFEAVRAELAKSIVQLKADQRFFVVFFNHGFFPMTGNAPRPQLVAADQKHKQEILAFLRSASSGGGTDPEPALQFMTALRPDVIYLLTDGEFSPLHPETYNRLTAARIAVHTIGFETGFHVPILQEIATRTLGTYRSATLRDSASSLFFQDPAAVRAALAHADPAVRREAIAVAIVRQLPLVKELIDRLGDADETVRLAVREELRNLAEGSDFGPRDADDAAAAVARWNRWWTLRKAPRAALLAALSGGDPDDLWVAASLMRTNRVTAPDECIAALRGAPSPVWQELRAALRQGCPGKDFGPPDGADAGQVAAAADAWAAWRTEELERLERERVAKRIKLAKEKLRLARDLVKDNPEAVERRCRELIRDFADTPSAAEAKALLEEIGGSLEDE